MACFVNGLNILQKIFYSLYLLNCFSILAFSYQADTDVLCFVFVAIENIKTTIYIKGISVFLTDRSCADQILASCDICTGICTYFHADCTFLLSSRVFFFILVYNGCNFTRSTLWICYVLLKPSARLYTHYIYLFCLLLVPMICHMIIMFHYFFFFLPKRYFYTCAISDKFRCTNHLHTGSCDILVLMK